MALFRGKSKKKPVLSYYAYYGADSGKTFDYGIHDYAATTVGDYALFGGGRIGSSGASHRSSITTYSKSLVCSNVAAAALSSARDCLDATTVGNYAIFGGGVIDGFSNYVDAYNKSLVKSVLDPFTISRGDYDTATVGNYALFIGGGRDYNASTGQNTAEVYDSSLTHLANLSLNSVRRSCGATSVGNYAIFGGGILQSDRNYSATPIKTVEAFDSSLTHINGIEDLSKTRHTLDATSVGNYAIFGPGHQDYAVDTVDFYNSSLTRLTPSALAEQREEYAATTLGNYAIFGGGYCYIRKTVGTSHISNFVETFDKSLTYAMSTNLRIAKQKLKATSVGNYAIFGGGRAYTNGVDSSNGTSDLPYVDVYALQ